MTTQHQQQPPQAATVVTREERARQINQTLDTLLENVANLTPLLIAREERYGYGDKRVADGWKRICDWLEEVDRLEGERRRQARAATRPLAS